GFDTSSWILADHCKKRNKKFILDVSIGHPLSKEKIYRELSESYIEWKQQVVPKKHLYIELECAEMDLADIIVVPSGFVKQTLVENGVAADKIKINPFGTFVEQFSYSPSKQTSNGRLTFL